MFGPLLGFALRALYKSLRVETSGAEHLLALRQAGQPFIPCAWHQRQFGCVFYLGQRPELNLAVVVSPSLDGELVSRIIKPLCAEIIRGSATRSGAETLRDLYQAIVRRKRSMVIHPDGPRGPARSFKLGTLLLAQWSGAPLLPLAFAADRVWQFDSWDRLILPKPFARTVIAIGAPRSVARNVRPEQIEGLAVEMGRTLDELIVTAERLVE
jgi:lysophospholipid acyltransferase (LPLAT)-like uncharacterized protein